ncbi:PepSY domain-containing protein [Paenibacillus nicotianae]|uniref:PepSY domain-containing protein n=1 Tax=Paenibacillus nicotianae TaxID=1526551 RepID=A0ABW4UW66_9BACL
MHRTVAPSSTNTLSAVIKDKRWWIAGAVVILLILMFVMTLWWKSIAQASPALTSTQAKNVVLKQYPGKVTETALNNGIYTVQLQSDQGMYQVQVNGNSGAIQSIQQIGQSAVATTTPNSTTNTDSSNSSNSSATNDSNSSSSAVTEPTTATNRTESTNDSSSNSSSSVSEDSTDTNNNPPASTDSSPSATTNENDDRNNSSNSGSDNNQPQVNEQPGDITPDANVPPAGSPVPPVDNRDHKDDRKGKDKDKDKDKNNSPRPAPVLILKEKDAERIALTQVPGKVDDTDYEDDEDKGQSYYLVDIDTPDEREATVQINAVSGAVMSVTWDDVDDSDNEK